MTAADAIGIYLAVGLVFLAASFVPRIPDEVASGEWPSVVGWRALAVMLWLVVSWPVTLWVWLRPGPHGGGDGAEDR